MSRAMRAGLVLAALALFAFGVVVGRGTITTRSGTALPAPEAANRSSSQTAPPSSTLTSSTPPTSATPTPTSDASSEATLTPPAWPAAVGACGTDVPLPIVEGTRPLPTRIQGRLVVGGPPTRVDLGTATVGKPLVTPGSDSYVVTVAADGDSVAAVFAPCSGQGTWSVTRVDADGTASAIPVGDPQNSVGLVGGDRVWIMPSSTGAYGSAPITLVAADDPRVTVTLPTGLVPLADRGNTIVGQYVTQGAPQARFAEVDSRTGAIIRTFGDTVPADGATMANVAVDGDYLVTAPWACDGPCTIRRYDLATEAVHSAELTPAADHILAGSSVAISPDGSTAAVALPDQRPSPAPFDPNAPSSTGPSAGTTRIGLIDLDSGSVRALPGITLGPTNPPALAFTDDGKWLVVAIDEGDATRLLLYTAHGEGPYDPHLAVPGASLWPWIVDTTQ